ncbi:MAG: MATE family efflux transporter [Micrococcales bacterium]|nr:MATE family efflux transporter [Micrococcales bacterium]
MGDPGEQVSESRQILRLAVPAFLALIAEPLFLLADSAIIGHLGTAQLAGLGVASATLMTAVNLFVFLAYGTTSVVARQLGAGSVRGALEAGVDGTWLAIGLGALTGLGVGLWAEPLCRLFGASPAAVGEAATYLRVAALGIPAMLVTLAVTGVLRGLQDMRTPLVASVTAFAANIVLNLLFVYGFGWGIAGSAWGTVIAQWGMALALLAVMVRGAGRHGASLHPHPGRVLTAALGGMPLLLRTLALRAILLVTTWVAAGLGDVPLAAYQVSYTIWSALTFALDALAIAAQALTGRALGAGDLRGTRSTTSTMLRWGVWAGAVLGALVLAAHRVLPHLFTGDPAVQRALAAGLIVVALMQPLSGLVFVIDGVLIGAGDGRWLAGAMVLTLALYLPLVLAVHAAAPRMLSSPDGAAHAVLWLWAAFTGFMAIRGALFWWRIRGDRWMVVGATR